MFCWKYYKNSVFSRAQLLCIADSKAPFEGKPKWHFCNQKCHFGCSPAPAETPIFVVFGGFEWTQKRTIFAKQIVATKMRVFYLPNTNSVCLFFNAISANNLFCSQPPPKHYFSGPIWNLVSIFSYFLFFFLQHKEDKNKKCTFLFENPFLTPWHIAKNYFRTPTHHLCFKDAQKNTIKLEKANKSWTKLWLKNQILDQVLTLQHILYVYIYIYVLILLPLSLSIFISLNPFSYFSLSLSLSLSLFICVFLFLLINNVLILIIIIMFCFISQLFFLTCFVIRFFVFSLFFVSF